MEGVEEAKNPNNLNGNAVSIKRSVSHGVLRSKDHISDIYISRNEKIGQNFDLSLLIYVLIPSLPSNYINLTNSSFIDVNHTADSET